MVEKYSGQMGNILEGKGYIHATHQEMSKFDKSPGDWLQESGRRDPGFYCRSNRSGGREETSEVYPDHWLVHWHIQLKSVRPAPTRGGITLKISKRLICGP